MEKLKLGTQTLLYPMPTVLVGSMINHVPNFMTVAWCNIVSYKPPALAIAVQKSRYTLEGIKEEGVFSVNVPSTDLVERVDYCGIYSGKKKDKSHIFEIFYGSLKNAPLIQECPVNMECKKINNLVIGSHVLIIGEIIETYVNRSCLINGVVDIHKIDPIIYTISDKNYYQVGKFIAKAFNIGKNYSK